MRLNEPITRREHLLPEGVTLMSSTDLKGRITYANAAFVAASGFEHGALLGQPHNLVRHPDMPAEAFADLWRTLQAGDSWTAVVKNRRQDGDHYWVRANAAPIRQQGRVVGYLSVRTAVARDESAAAEQLYRRVREGRARGWRFHKGVLVRRGMLAGLSAGRWMSVRTRLRLGLALPVLGALVACGVAVRAGTPPAPLAAVAAGVALAAGLGCAWLERQLASPLRAVLKQAQQVAAGQGDGQARLDRVDEVGLLMRAVNQAGLNLRALLDDVGGQLGGLRSASQEIAAGSQDLSVRTEHNASSLQQAAASMEELHGTVRHSADHAQQARDLAGATCGAAGRGNQVVAGVVKTMDDLSQGARRIGDIVGVIDGLAFQTNLLALNAAVEAARAGPQGRAFAVVAGEVRTLAQRCAQAAREIKGLAGTSEQQVHTGAQRVAEAGQAMQAIVDQAQRAERLVGEISRAATEQAAGVGQVNDTVNRLDAATQQNAALVEQSAAAAASLAEQAAHLAAAVRVFRPEPAAA